MSPPETIQSHSQSPLVAGRRVAEQRVPDAEHQEPRKRTKLNSLHTVPGWWKGWGWCGVGGGLGMKDGTEGEWVWPSFTTRSVCVCSFR